MEKSTIQKYINNFRRHLSNRLRAGIGMKAYIYPTDHEGVVLVFQLGKNLENDDVYKKTFSSLNEVLATKVKQNAFGGDLANVTFSGTNTILENDRIIFIKDDSLNEWTDEAAKKDINKLFHSNR
ncbi:hypothetical protein [Acinetobacter johnsonii]|uniref:hypothetical protein n=1 Tax=Acinetobacter johnsonii TaxID=40214 RepID=UPI0007B41D2C|nr:hypothetical protein [Acinetobacter johnsonii]